MPAVLTQLAYLKWRASNPAVVGLFAPVYRSDGDAANVHRSRANADAVHRSRVDATTVWRSRGDVR